jgi:hypothetical protein
MPRLPYVIQDLVHVEALAEWVFAPGKCEDVVDRLLQPVRRLHGFYGSLLQRLWTISQAGLELQPQRCQRGPELMRGVRGEVALTRHEVRQPLSSTV